MLLESRKPLMGVPGNFNNRHFLPDVLFENFRTTLLDLKMP
jgi:hypothetical protein